MDIVFDQPLLAANRRRAAIAGDPKAAFLLDIAAEELAERLTVVERHFDEGVELHGGTGVAARAGASDGPHRPSDAGGNRCALRRAG